MKKMWKKSSVALALVAGVMAGAAMAAIQTSDASAQSCPTTMQCDIADRTCLDHETTPSACATWSRCLECGYPY